IAAPVQPEIGKCIHDWYYKEKDLQPRRHDEILAVMAEYSGYDPTAVLVGYIEAVCEEFQP
ncbi:MAG: hypothetical protein AAGF25_14195, partial [Pseudomonadota bacterium]